MAKGTRTTISVPSDLKTRMEEAGDSINWSAVACRAFEQTLAEITKRKEIANMNEVVARLRASKRSLQSDRSKAGFAQGKAWAENYAEAVELERLEKQIHAQEHTSFDWNNAYSSGENFAFVIAPEDDGDREVAERFWSVFDRGPELSGDPGFVNGFAEGAMEVWDRVKDEL